MNEIYHGNTGNQNAAKENPRKAVLGVRMTQDDYEQLKAAAKAANLSLSAYALSKLKQGE